MKTLKQLLFIAIAAGSLASCKKDQNVIIGVASLNVVDASPGVSNALVRTPNVTGYYAQLSGVGFAGNYVFTIPAGSAPITVVSSADTAQSLYRSQLPSKAGDIYSLFIGGSAGEDIVLNRDKIPDQADSTFGVRFINMSTGSSSVNVTLAATPATNEFSSIAYKSITDFKVYHAHSTDPTTYTFQVRDGSGNLLATAPDITSSTATLLNHNVTLVFTGGAAPQVFIVNNY